MEDFFKDLSWDTQMSLPWLKSKLKCLGYSVSKCNRTWMTTKRTLKYGTVITKIIVTNDEVKLIDKNKM